MSWLRRVLKLDAQQPETTPQRASDKKWPQMPTVKFDASLVTKKVKADLRENIDQLEDIPKKDRRSIYDAALSMIEAGGNMPLLYNPLLKLAGMSTSRAGEITRLLLFRAKAFTEQESRMRLGITHAVWMYANAPCIMNPGAPTDADLKQDAAHQAANGKKFEIAKGLKINGEWTLPGRGAGCKCVSRSVIPGL